MATTKEVLSLAVEIADVMLRNGGEIYRIEDTVIHILKAYNIENFDVYLLSNGIFASAKSCRFRPSRTITKNLWPNVPRKRRRGLEKWVRIG